MQDKNHPFIKSAIDTIAIEIDGLESLVSSLDENFINAVNLILNCKGRIIISGMGKSGYIASKTAASFSSTGTPSYFIHPSEASHGDLGMISQNDIVILFSNSGETKELQDIIYYCKRFEIPIIGIVRQAESDLVRNSAVALILPNIAEANKINAPTTSTTMMLAIGDALAVTLINARGFDAKKFSMFHPGGKLGSAFIKAENLMRKNQEIPIVKENELMPQVLLEMTSKHLGCVAVIDEKNHLQGIITDGDLRRHITENFLKMTAKEIMTKSPQTIEGSTLIAEAIAIFNKKSITNLFVLDSEKIVGILHIHDCLRAGF